MSDPLSPSSRIRAALARSLVLAAALAAAVALVACGGSNTGTNAAASEQAKERNAEAKLAQFAKCLREHGIETQTSSSAGHQGFGIRVKDKTGAGREQMEAAQRACQKYRPSPEKVNVSPQEKVAREEAVQKFAKCMREHGIEVHASTSGGTIQIGARGAPGSGPNPESPAFQSAQKACQGLLPFKGSAKGVPGPGAAVGVGG
jgi:hypothetical protein